MQSVLDAIEVFFDHLAAVSFGALGVGVCFHIVRGLAVSRAWRNVIDDAYPDERVRWRSIYGSYLAGVGINALIPARVGDGVRLYLAKHRVSGATYTTLATTLLVMSIFDICAASALFLFALQAGVLPASSRLPDLPSFDFGWLFGHPQLAAALGLVVGIIVGVALVWAIRHVRAFKQRVGQGFAVLRNRGRYLRRVVAFQCIDWTCRLATTYWFLTAFHVDASIRNALFAQVSQSLSTTLPISPSGIGTEQALLLVVLAGEASRSNLLAYSVGMKLTIIAVNVTLGVIAIGLMARTLSFRELARRRRAEQAAEDARTADESAAERPA